MNKSESIKNLAVALGKAQSEMREVKFDSKGNWGGYASLGAVIDASKEALVNNGLSVSQPTTTNEYGVGVTTILLHTSGEYIESTMTLPVAEVKNIAQEAGKIITYLRRYSLASILNLYSDEDTDGNKGTQSSTKASKTAKVEESTPKKATPAWTSEQIAAAVDLYPEAHSKELVNSMNLSNKLTAETTPKDLQKWFKYYKTARKSSEPLASALIADSKLFG